jgi:hypothetical protein
VSSVVGRSSALMDWKRSGYLASVWEIVSTIRVHAAERLFLRD